MNRYCLPAEWHRQSLIQIAWPHAETDWVYTLAEVQRCYLALISEISRREPLLILAPDPEEVKTCLRTNGLLTENITFFACSTNDTWVRDYGFLTLVDPEGRPLLLDFRFNGWGMKFAANWDNQVNTQLYRTGILHGAYQDCRDFVLEGGSIESDGKGTLLTTTGCLLAANRNEPMTVSEIEATLRERFGAKRILWLHHGHLAGDDTDSHVDTLARLCPNDTIAYVKCTDPADEHFEDLRQMEKELHTFRTLEGKPFRLLPLPMASPEYDELGKRLPATYANFLIMNEAVLYPAYGQPVNDLEAKEALAQAFPERQTVGIDCRALIRQHGSLHCAAMQYPENVFIHK